MWPIKITLPHFGADVGLKFLPDDCYCHAVFKCPVDTFDIQHFSSVRTPTSKFKPFIATMIHILFADVALLGSHEALAQI